MADVARCQEAIASYVLDAGEPVSYRALASQIGGGASSAVRAQALAAFCQANAATGGVGAVHVSIVKSASSHTKSADPRARVIRVSTAVAAPSTTDEDASIYGVFPSSASSADESVQEAMTLALWAQERKVRNDLFAGRARHSPLSRELQAFYESDVQCAEATSRADMMAGSRGEEAVSMFDSIKATTTGRAQAAAASKSSFFKSSGSTSTASTTASSSSKSGSSSSSSSFFKSSGNGTSSANAKPASAAKSSVAETKRIDAKAMNNVLSVDSDSDEDEDDGGAPKFVKTTPATKARATKRVMISDDEDEDFEMIDASPAKKETPASAPRPSAKRKLSDSPEPPTKQTKKTSSPARSESPKRKRDDETVQEEEPQPEEEEELPSGPIKRRQLVNKTRITDDGYMVTEKTYEEVEVTAEELAKERAEAKKKQAAAKAAADAQKARAAAAAAAANNNSKSAKSGGPAKQKKLDFFFARK